VVFLHAVMATGIHSRSNRFPRFRIRIPVLAAAAFLSFAAPTAFAEVLGSHPDPAKVENASIGIFEGLAPHDRAASGTLYFKFRVNPLFDSAQKAEQRKNLAGMLFCFGARENLGIGNDAYSWAYSAFCKGISPHSLIAGQLTLKGTNMQFGRFGPYIPMQRGILKTFVFRVQYVPGADARVTVWAEPNLSPGATELSQPDGSITRFTADASFDQIRLVHRGDGPGWIFDNLAVATSFEDFVPEPLWRRTWFLAAVFATLVVVVAIAFGVYERARSRRRILLAERESAISGERMRIARDLHDELGSGLTEVLLLGEMAAKSGTDRLPEILRGLRRLHESLDEVVWSTNPRNDSLDRLAGFIIDFARRFVGNSTAEFHAEVPEEFPAAALSTELRHNLLLAVKEALNNAVRHSSAANIRLGMVAENGRIRISITDDGSGMDVAAVQAGDGLRNMADRLRAVGGETRIRSTPGSGTEVVFELPTDCRREGRRE
jgi:signal transduction histidine kinase